MATDNPLNSIEQRILRLTEINQENHRQAMAEYTELRANATRQEQQLEVLVEQVEVLVEQVGRMTEGITELRLAAESQERKVDRVLEVQSRNVDRLVGIVEALIPR
jgi:hypothetical protein